AALILATREEPDPMGTTREATSDLAVSPRQMVLLSRTAWLVLCAAMIATALMAGLYYSYAISVMPGLARVDDRMFVTVMQNINEVIQNAAFAAAFAGAVVLAGAAAILQWRLGRRAATRWTVAALIFYVVSLAITMGINVPLNDQLAAAGDPSQILDLAAVRRTFEGLWVTANVARTVACLLALVCFGQALSLHGRGEAVGPDPR
ncbi:MAG: DUF1772 domain-containing protein, partial [Pseudonocardiaceae bacterium]